MKIEVVKSDAPRPLAHYNEAVKYDSWVFAAGQIASDYKTGVPPEAKRHPEFPFYGSDIKQQTRYVLNNLKKTFAAAGSSFDNVVKAQVFLTDLDNFSGFDEIWREYFSVPPPRTTVGTTGLLVPGTLVEIDLIGYAKDRGISHSVVKSSVPQPLANYSEAIVVNDLIFAAGQLASDFKSGVPGEAKKRPGFPYYGSDIKRQTYYILDNLKTTFEKAGGSLDNVFKAQVFLRDLADFSDFDEVWKEYFKQPPARTTIGTTGLLVEGTLIEIDLIGHVKGGKVNKERITSNNPQPLANYSEAFRVADLVFAAGQLSSDFKSGVAPEARVDPAFPYYASAIKKQTRYTLNNLKNTLEAAGSSLDRVVKAQVFLTDLNDFYAFDEVWKEFFPSPPPRTTIGTTGLLVKGALVEIDLIASMSQELTR
jgi:enamine deaminase RidA (YjgF/YER057c/UK114 family)